MKTKRPDMTDMLSYLADVERCCVDIEERGRKAGLDRSSVTKAMRLAAIEVFFTTERERRKNPAINTTLATEEKP